MASRRAVPRRDSLEPPWWFDLLLVVLAAAVTVLLLWPAGYGAHVLVRIIVQGWQAA